MTITFVGHGYVGLVTACVFADLGNTVYVIGHTPEKLKRLASGDPIIYEPGLSELLKKNLAAKRIHFTDSFDGAISSSDIVFLAVGTPPKENGEADLSTVLTVAENIAKNLKKGYTVVACKSTVPVGTNHKIHQLISKLKPKNASFDVASCPEFLREGSALQDTFQPDRVIIGSDSKAAVKLLMELHASLPGQRVIVGLESAELIKYASNCILATKISFANLIAFICEQTGADVNQVLDGVGMDKRIGRIFMDPGVGYGGSCFPKDVKALISTGQEYGVDMNLLKAVDQVNDQAKQIFLKKILDHAKGKKIAIWGLAFKPNTDDIRFAASTFIIENLLENDYQVVVYDPEASKNIRRLFGNKIAYTDDPYSAVKGVDCLVILTEWNEFKQIDLAKTKKLLRQPMIIDGRNIYEPHTLKALGFSYISVGRDAII